MSRIKNSEEFQRMMDEQELAASFKYQEQEAEKDRLFEQLAAVTVMNNACNEYIEAQKVFMEAQKKFSEALKAYKDHKGDLNEEEEEVSSALDTLTDLFKSFNPNS